MVRRLLGQALVVAAALSTLGLFTPSIASAQKKYELVVTGPSVNIRTQPDSNARVVGKASQGDRFPALGPSADKRWIKIRYKGREAWVTAAPKLVNVREATGGGSAPPASDPNAPAWTTVVRDTEVRLGPGGNAPVVTDVLRGDFLKFGGFSKDKRFVRVQTSDGSSGWVARSDVVPGRRDDIGPAGPPEKHGRKHRTPRNPYAGRQGARENRVVRVVPAFALIRQSVATEFSSFHYTTTAYAPGAQAWVDWNLRDNFIGGRLDLSIGYLFALTGGVPAPPQLTPGEEVVLAAQVHRLDLGTTYRRDLGFMDLIAVGGYRFHLYYIQPQTLSYYFSNNYHTLNLQVGASIPLLDYRMFIDVRGGVLPGLLIETYGKGQSGSSGNVPIALGYEADLSVRYTELPGGFQGGLDLGFTWYQTRFQGTGQRAGSVFDNAFVQDMVISAGLLIRKSF